MNKNVAAVTVGQWVIPDIFARYYTPTQSLNRFRKFTITAVFIVLQSGLEYL